MALSALGVEVGPLIAGAGVVGVAVGFGAQTLVKDILSGMFFLLDDAFRVGEYIESGSIRGTVEAFSLRSIKLRHHRGALHTRPVRLARQDHELFARLGDRQADDRASPTTPTSTRPSSSSRRSARSCRPTPNSRPHIIEPLKMQGVEAFGDFAIQIRLKMMTQPGEQFVIRREA